MIEVLQPFQQFFDVNGSPLDNGYIYVGEQNLNPETYPIIVYWDEAGSLPAAQPIRTSNGYPIRNGAPAQLFVNALDYSLTVRDSSSSLVAYSSSISSYFGGIGLQLVNGYTALRAITPTADRRIRLGYGASLGDGAFGDFYAVTGGSPGTYVDNGGTIIVPTGGDGSSAWLRDYSGSIDARWFGAKGDGVTDDTASLAAWIVACQNKSGKLPYGVYAHTGLTFLPQYSYNIEGDVYDNDAIGGTVLLNTNTLGGNGITINNTPFVQNYDSQIRFSNLTVKGNASSGDGFNVDQTMVFLENVWITGNGGHGYSAIRCYSSAFRQVSFSNNYKSGFVANRALNAVHFDHCIFNGNAFLTGYSGCQLGGAGGADSNFAVTFTSCDFTGNGATLIGADIAYGAAIQYSSGVTMTGCYGEGNKTRIIYSDNTVTGLKIGGSFWQDGVVELLQVNGLIYENNEHYDSGGATTQLIIDGGLPTVRAPLYIKNNAYSGTVTKIFTGGASDTVHALYSSPPSSGSWAFGDTIWNNSIQNGGGILGWVNTTTGIPGTWLPIGVVPQVFVNHGDAAATLTVGSSFPTNLWQSPLTANRTVTLSTSGAFSGAKFKITRTAGSTGAFTLDVGVGPLKSLASGQWCDVEFDGTNWVLTAYGTL